MVCSMLRTVSMFAAVVAFAACMDLPGRAAQEATAVQALEDDCQAGGVCPTNSPVVATFPFIDMPFNREWTNTQGFSIKAFLIGGVDHEFRVTAGHIKGMGRGGPVTGPALEGAQLWLRRGTAAEYVLRINHVTPVKMWARIPSIPPVSPIPQTEAYEIDWAEVFDGQPVNDWKNVCAEARRPPGDDVELLGAPNTVTFVFEGERIDARAKRIYDFDTRWFNLGCAGHTLAKMYLMGHVAAAAAAAPGYVTTIDERQTIMKMFAADYCGTGYAFTVPGMPLGWQDDKRWAHYVPPITGFQVEARWTPTGAACLNAPRAEANGTADTAAMWPHGIRAEITARCPDKVLPVCTNGNIQAFDGYHMVTANPPPP